MVLIMDILKNNLGVLIYGSVGLSEYFMSMYCRGCGLKTYMICGCRFDEIRN